MANLLKNTSKYLSRLWNRQLLVFLFFLILSSAFWLFLAGKEQREADFEVALNLTDVPDNVVITTHPPKSVTLRLRDEAFTLMRYEYMPKGPHKVDLKWADIVNDDGHIRLQMADVLKPVTTLLSSTTTIVGRRPDVYEIFFNYGQCKVVPTRLYGTVNASDDYNIVSTEVLPATVKVYASKAVLDTIKYVYTETVRINDCKGKKTVPVKFRQAPGIKVSPAEGKLSIVADRYTEKTVQVNVRSINLPAHTSLRTFPSKVDVTFQVGAGQYQEITDEAFDIVIDYNKLPKALTAGNGGEKGGAIKYVLSLTDVPLGVRHARIVPDEVECIIEHDGE